MAHILGFSKSAMHRGKKAIEERNLFPESLFWETNEGRTFLCRLFVGVLFLFGIKIGIGARTISEFFKLLHIDKHVSSSPTTIKNNINKIQGCLKNILRTNSHKKCRQDQSKLLAVLVKHFSMK